jgi:Tfp pilus assembly protein PilN
MNQQINLHQPIFRKQRALFSSQIVLRICAIWAVALVLVYGLNRYSEGTLAREHGALERNRDAAQARLQQLVSTQDETGHSQQLENELERLRNERAQKESVLRVLARGELGSTAGFAPQLDALADRRLAGVWLTHIGLMEGGREISLRGEASREDLLPRFIERLATGSGFPGARFGDLRLERAADSSQLSFELHTRAGTDMP